MSNQIALARRTAGFPLALAVLGFIGAAAGCGRAATHATPPAAAPAPAAAFDRSMPPEPGPMPALTLPPVERRTLPNGLTLLVVEHHELPVADFILIVSSGGEADPRGKTGAATLTAAMLDEGAGDRDALGVADQESFLGIRLSTSGGWDASTVALHTPTAQLDSALALFADVALRPTFPARELERLRQERLTQLIQLRDQPRAIASLAHAAILYGPEHPYGSSLIGTEQTTRAITRSDIQQFYEQHYRPNNATLVVVGDVTPDDVERRARAHFGAWTQRAVPAPAFGRTPQVPTTTVYLIDKPGAPQSSIRIGTIGVPRSTEDYFPILVMNTILGGSFTSRLNQNLRETHGYSYGAGSGFSMRRAAGPFVASAEVTGTKTDSSLVEFMKELRAIRDTVPAAELAKAKQYLQLQLPLEFETTGDIASQLVPLALYGLPLDYYNTYGPRIEEVSQADVQRVAQRYIDPDRLAIVVVGDRQSIEGTVRALGLGNVSIRDLSGQPSEP